MSPDRLVWAVQWERFPRVSGDEPHPAAAALFADGFSPRERG